MRWSKVRKLVEESFAPSVRGRVTIHSTNGKQKGVAFRCPCGWGWISIDGKPIAHFITHASYDIYGTPYHETTGSAWKVHPAVADEERAPGQLVEVGEFSRFDLHEACWRYLHSSLNESIASPNPFIQSLAVLNARVGKHRLRRISLTHLHPLTRALLQFRMGAEASGATADQVTKAVG